MISPKDLASIRVRFVEEPHGTRHRYLGGCRCVPYRALMVKILMRGVMATGISFYVGLRMREWGMDSQPRSLRTSFRKVLSELDSCALLYLKDPRFEVLVTPEDGFCVWAYFPVHRNRIVARELKPKPQTRVLMVISVPGFKGHSASAFEGHLRDHLGHVLLYLRDPQAWNDCDAAWKEWCQCRRPTLRSSGIKAARPANCPRRGNRRRVAAKSPVSKRVKKK
jgi:hypothetical protein